MKTYNGNVHENIHMCMLSNDRSKKLNRHSREYKVYNKQGGTN